MDTGRVGAARGGEAADSATNVVAGHQQYLGTRDEESSALCNFFLIMERKKIVKNPGRLYIIIVL